MLRLSPHWPSPPTARELAAGVLLLAIAGGCGDNLADRFDELESCPCGEGRTCCWDRCYANEDGCVVENTFGRRGGVLSAPNGTTFSIPSGSLAEEALVRMRSVQSDAPAGVVPLADAVLFETLWARGVLTMPYDPGRVPPDTDPDNVLLHSALPGSKALARLTTTLTADTMRAQIYRGNRIYVPAVSQPPCAPDLDCIDGCGIVDLTIDGDEYRVLCPGGDAPGDAEFGITCRCSVNGSTRLEVPAACGSAEEVHTYECGFPCPDGPVPDAGPC